MLNVICQVSKCIVQIDRPGNRELELGDRCSRIRGTHIQRSSISCLTIHFHTADCVPQEDGDILRGSLRRQD
ncbi:hypothetical protein A8E36_01850 [Burkholderia cenocepacia]|nr:hypothetical protein A8D88_04350 [Burkholderia cenocepacia]ONP81311.1 hypothetical protein A8D94_03250 [Burkholderia cenocepacia]ONQ78840.1 hypothetical protein A8E06_05850 [Burkholderia cenocepacia]ONQ96988.1 hypothetical protein A8E08_10420 [Burkholderia cenocepacia]ONR19490.1 hypothetical protein A8E14_10745 [Burkholderia cenocepacia]